MRRVLRWARSAAPLPLLAVASSALPHIEQARAAGFSAGVLHPVSGLDHVLAMIAVGLWGAQLGRPAIWVLPVAFPMTMAIGGFLGLIGMPLPGIELGIAFSVVVLGVVVAFESRPPLAVAAIVVAVFAVFHGHAHGTELPPASSAVLYSIGFVVATGCLHATGIAIGLIHRWAAGRRALRVMGGVVGLTGLAFVWRAFA